MLPDHFDVPLQYVPSPSVADGAFPLELDAVLPTAQMAAAWDEIRQWDGYAPTPLHDLPGLARAAGTAAILYKDEGGRFGLKSFKALGGAYQVLRVLVDAVSRQVGHPVSMEAVRSGAYGAISRAMTVATATDGNHGRSVAWGAQRFGCRCRVTIHAEVSEARADAIRAFGADVNRIAGNYDESVRHAAAEAAANGWTVVSDTAYSGYHDLPRHVMAGYAVMAFELFQQLSDHARPTHFFLQAGVGGMAAALAAAFWAHYGAAAPRVVVVEPDRAACLLASARADAQTAVPVETETVMAGLSCGAVSDLAWPILRAAASDFLAIPDEAIGPTMRLLASGVDGDPGIAGGESGVAGLSGALAALREPDVARKIGLGPDSRILVIGSEGVTDPEIYAALTNAA